MEQSNNGKGARSAHFRNNLDVVTGGAGFIGSHLVDRLLSEGRSIRIIDNFSSGGPHNLQHLKDRNDVEVIQADIRDRDEMLERIEGAARVFHIAALADIVPSIQQPEIYFDVNVGGTLNTLEAARAAGVDRFVYAASGSCYGIPEDYPTPEYAPIKPAYPYALTKNLGERMALHWAEVYDLPVVSLRFFNVYGPRSRTSGAYGAVFGVFLAQLLAGKALTIVGDGRQTRDFTFVSDAVSAIAAAASSDVVGEYFNVGSGCTISVNYLVELLGATETVHIPKRPGEPDCTLADISKIRNRLGWEPDMPIEDGVSIMLDNINYWRDAPVWNVESIAEATKEWFAHLKNV